MAVKPPKVTVEEAPEGVSKERLFPEVPTKEPPVPAKFPTIVNPPEPTVQVAVEFVTVISVPTVEGPRVRPPEPVLPTVVPAVVEKVTLPLVKYDCNKDALAKVTDPPKLELTLLPAIVTSLSKITGAAEVMTKPFAAETVDLKVTVPVTPLAVVKEAPVPDPRLETAPTIVVAPVPVDVPIVKFWLPPVTLSFNAIGLLLVASVRAVVCIEV